MKQSFDMKKILTPMLGLVILFPMLSYSQLTSVQVVPENTTVGQQNIHTITFVHADTIPADGVIVIRYPSGFDLSTVSIVYTEWIDGALPFSVAGTTLTIRRSGSGDPELPTHTESIRLANVTNATTVESNYQVVVETRNANNSLRESGTSAAFTLTPGPVETFNISLPASVTGTGAIAGTPFQADIEALDAWGNLATSFGSAATLSDQTGTLIITSNGANQTTNTFSSGLWSGNVRILKTVPTSTNYIRATSGTHSGQSSSFSARPGALDEFRFDAISSPRTAGVSFSLIITAYDSYDNVQTEYTNPVTLSEKTGTITVPSTASTSTGNFTAGTWMGNVQITQANTDIYIQATGGGQTGTSGPFNVNGAGVDHFTFSNISSPQVVGEYFLVTITARDEAGNVATSFSGSGRRVTISHAGGTANISPIQSGDFSNGVWTGNLRITQIATNDQISVNDGSGHVGQSNMFNVDPTSSVDHFVISSIGGTQTAGVDFSVTIRAVDINGNTAVFTGQVNVFDETGTLTLSSGGTTSGNFSAGVRTESVRITKSGAGNSLTVIGPSNKSGTSTDFIVVGAGVSRFELSQITSPRTAGVGFSTTITAYDVYGNISQLFTGSVSLSAGAVPLSPASSGAFSNGSRTVNNLTITQTANDVQIAVSDGSGHSGTSNYFNVTHNTLHHFAVVDSIATQTPGVPFSLTVTAQDDYNNTVTSFTGTVNISHLGSAATLTRTLSEPFKNGVWSNTIAVLQTQTPDRIVVTRSSGGSQTGTSNQFNVTPTIANLHHFTFNSIPTNQTAGQGFSITVRAYDANNNLVTAFTGTNGTASLADETGTNTPKQLIFTGGVATATVIITETQTQNTLTVTAAGKSGVSDEFNVVAGAVHSISVASVASPQIAGAEIAVNMTALDAFENVATQFGETVSLSDLTGTLTRVSGGTTSGNFIAGRRTEAVRIAGARNDVVIYVARSGGQRDTSNSFNVLPGALYRFTITPDHIPNQIVGIPFSITITAEDEFHNVKTNFNQTVDIADQTGILSPNISLSNGVVTTSITINQAVSNDVIRVTNGTIISTSNPAYPFGVVIAPGIQVSDFRAVRGDRSSTIQSVTTDQEAVWYLRCTVQNLSGVRAQLDSVRLQFTVAGLPRQDYTVQLPATFWGNGTAILDGSQIDSLLIPVNLTGHDPGPATIRIFIYNLVSGVTLSDDAFTNLQVQTPANLVIRDVRPSQDEVSRNQTQLWRVSVIVSNTGGSAVQMDSARAATYLIFSLSPASWDVLRPPAWTGDWILEGGETDSLMFSIRRTANETGVCRIDAFLAGVEINTGLEIERDTQDGEYGQVVVETPASLSIAQTINSAPNSPYVNRAQGFNLDIQIRNTGGDAVRDVEVQIGTTGSSSFVGTHNIGILSGGQLYSLKVPVTAANLPNASEVFTVSASGYAENTDLYIDQDANSPDRSANATIQNPATIQVLSVTPTKTQLLGGQNDPWDIKVAVRNTGGAEFELSKPAADSVSFFVGGIYQSDYKVIPPVSLQGGGLILHSGDIDTLIYTVNNTGTYGGQVAVQARVGGKDRNDLRTLKTSGPTQVTVEAEKAFRIISTQIEAINTTDAKNGFVNTGQAFRALVIFENGLSYTIRNIDVRLRKSGQSTIEATQVLIPLLEPSMRDSAWFNAAAATHENSGETFTSSIYSAKRENGSDAPIGLSIDSTAQVVIQTPASLSLTLTTDPISGVVSVNQEFTVTARVNKLGSSSLKDDGRVRIKYPAYYTLVTRPDTASILPSQPVTWTLQAPSDSSSNDQISVTLDRFPHDKNTNEDIVVDDNSVQIFMTTIASRLRSVTSISTPPGAGDGVLSTGQTFVVKTEVFHNNVEKITAKLELPAGYDAKNSLLQGVIGDTATWMVTAPDYPVSTDNLFVTAKGEDALQPSVTITGAKNTMTVTTVRRADLSLSLTIDSPPEAAEHRTVSPGQEFVIKAEVKNDGDAQTVGDTEVSLQTLPAGYTTLDALTKTLLKGEAFWTITAPTEPNSAAAQIEARITKIPADEHTNQPAFVSQAYQSVAVTLQSAWLAVSPLSLPSPNQSLTPGQTNVSLLAFELDNRGESGSYPVTVHEIRFEITGREGEVLAPSTALSRIEATDMTGETFYGTLTQIPGTNPVRISITGLEIPYNQNRKVLIRGRIALTETVPYFLVNLSDGQSILAKEADSERIVPIKNPDEGELEPIASSPFKIFDPTQEIQLWNSPNPFGEQGKESTNIYYYVPEPTSISFRIFTLVGQLVKTYDIPETEVAAGQVNRWIWDGRNDKGSQVLNGVYHLIMQTGDGQTYKSKMAFVK